ncbi:MAG: phosphoglycerate dehydrogenase [Acidimicrobiales bacterium]
MARVLITEPLAEAGIELLRRDGHVVDVSVGLDPEALRNAVVGADALIVRSATQVDRSLLAAGDRLKVVGRAGVGLDNVDVEAATARGVIVANAPTSNSISAAEHTLALLLAVARNVPQAHAALVAGRWERSQWGGVELHDKTLGIVGLGRIGALVAQRARAFGMRLVGHDPFVSETRAAELGVELLDLDEVVRASDFLTLHVARTPETVGLIDAQRLRDAKPGLRIVNVARGGIVDEADVADAIRSGTIAGAGLDVFDHEPVTESPLFGLPQVVVTPHLGASTVEAQDRAGVTIAEQVSLALAGDFVPFAVNVAAHGVSEEVRPFLPVAEQLGIRFARLTDATEIDIEFAGEIGGYDCRMAELAVLKGLMSVRSGLSVSYVNAEELAADAGVAVRSHATTDSPSGFVNGIRISGGGSSIAGTVLVLSGEMRIISIDDFTIDIPPADNLLVLLNDDTPGMIGRVGTLFGDAGVNIDDMHIGRNHEGRALMAIATSEPLPRSLIDSLNAETAVRGLRTLDL